MKIFKLILTFLFGLFMIYGGVNHFIKPEMYVAFIPDFLPNQFTNYLFGVLEIVCGVGVFIPPFRGWATLGILAMMLIFLPLHVWDVFREKPAIGKHEWALVRLPFQFLFIAWAWFISRK
jgi:uncharacterized membrane protein